MYPPNCLPYKACEARNQQVHYEIQLDELLMCEDEDCAVNTGTIGEVEGQHQCVVYDCRCGNSIHVAMENILEEGFVIATCESCSNVFKFVD